MTANRHKNFTLETAVNTDFLTAQAYGLVETVVLDTGADLSPDVLTLMTR